MKNYRFPVRTTAADGKEIVIVPLQGDGEAAIVDAADFDKLLDAGVSTQWTAAGRKGSPRYVRCAVNGQRGNAVQISRLITGAGQGQMVRYRNGNTYDLRRDNLVVTLGHGTRSDQKVLEDWIRNRYGDSLWAKPITISQG